MIFQAPTIEWLALAPLIALTAGLVAVVLVAVFGPLKRFAPAIAIVSMAAAAGFLLANWGDDVSHVSGTLSLDGLSIVFSLLILVTGIVTVFLASGDPAGEQAGRPDFLALLLGSVLGMVLLTQADNLITFFIALELFSIPLYALCGTDLRRRESLEAGLKYLIIGSLGSATLLFGMAFIYGASGATAFPEIAQGLTEGGLLSDPITLVGIGLVSVGLAFKVSLAPFHQWTPDVYQGAPTPVTAFMSVATKLAAFAVFVRFFIVALGPVAEQWEVVLGVLAGLSIVVGNLGALTQKSFKRMLGYSGIAQGGYIVTGLIVANRDGIDALAFYLGAYVILNVAIFSALVLHQRMTGYDDSITSLRGVGRTNRLVAWPITIGMLGLTGLPPTVGFLAKLYIVWSLVLVDWIWLAVLIVLGSMVSVGYYLRVVGVIWTPSAEDESSDTPTEADRDGVIRNGRALVAFAMVASVLAIVFGFVPDPLYDFTSAAGRSLTGFFP